MMIKSSEYQCEVLLQIVVSNWNLYPTLIEVYPTLNEWMKRKFCTLQMDLLITDKIVLAAQRWDGNRTIIFLGDPQGGAKHGMIISDGNDLRSILTDLLNKAKA